MSKIYLEVLDQPRKAVFNQLANFGQKAILADGTAIALQLAHRYSYDFDLFTPKKVSRNFLDQVITVFGKKIKTIADQPSELSFLTEKKIKISFIHFPFPPLHPLINTSSVPLLNLKDLASNKAYTIGRRGEYRDYVDLYFLLKSGLDLKKISQEAQKRFAGAFSPRLFLEQLVYLKDLKDKKIDFIKQPISPNQILEFFQKEIKSH